MVDHILSIIAEIGRSSRLNLMLMLSMAALSAATFAPPLRAAVSQSCTVGTLRTSDIPIDQVASVSIDVRKPDSLRLVHVTQFEPPCAATLQKSLMQVIQLSDGRVFLRSSAEGEYELQASPGPFGEEEYDKRTAAERKEPRFKGGALLASDRVNSRHWGGDFVGLWRVGRSWVVRSFSQLPDRSFTKPRPLLTSYLRIRSVTYFPSPDTPTGRLEVVQEQPDGTVRSLEFNWAHKSAFIRK